MVSSWNSSSQALPHSDLMTFQPAPRNWASSSCTILKLARTGPSRRCRLQLMTKVRLSRPSREASARAAVDSGSSISPSPRNAQTWDWRVVLDAAVGQIAVEARLVDRRQRAEAHGHRRELPQPGQPARVRVRRQAVAARLLAEVVELLLGEPAVEEGAGVDAGGGVALDVELVAGPVGLLALEEVVEAGLVEPGRGGEGGDVAADAVLGAPGHHRGRVPAVPRGDPALHRLVAGELRARRRSGWC